jgi:hypothetical protein
MAENQRGTTPVAWALPSGLTISGYTTTKVQGYTLAKEADEATVRDNRGQTVTEIYFDHRTTLSIDFIASGADIAAAEAANTLPDSGGVVTIGDTSTPDTDPVIAATHGGKYVCLSARKVASNSAEVRLSLELRQRRDIDIAVAIT